MRTIDISAATKSLAKYARDLNGQSVVVTKNAEPVAVLVPLGGAGRKALGHRAEPAFRKILREARESLRKYGGISGAELRRQLGLPPAKEVPPPRSSKSPAAKKR